MRPVSPLSRVLIGIDPGQSGAVAGLLYVPVLDLEGKPVRTRLSCAVILHAGGRAGYYGGLPELMPQEARAALAEAVRRARLGFGGPTVTMVRLEEIGRRPDESMRASATAEASHKVWRDLLASTFPGRWAKVSTAKADVDAGVPRRRAGRDGRKADVIDFAREELGPEFRHLLIPVGGRLESDGAADAVVLAASMR